MRKKKTEKYTVHATYMLLVKVAAMSYVRYIFISTTVAYAMFALQNTYLERVRWDNKRFNNLNIKLNG